MWEEDTSAPREDDRNDELDDSPVPDPESDESDVQEVRDLPLLLGQLHGHVDRALARHGPAEDLVLADLVDREVAPWPVLVRLGKAERQVADPLLDRRQAHVRILPFRPRPRREPAY